MKPNNTNFSCNLHVFLTSIPYRETGIIYDSLVYKFCGSAQLDRADVVIGVSQPLRIPVNSITSAIIKQLNCEKND